jgi:lipopolysaccharide transport system ATP-binding protein
VTSATEQPSATARALAALEGTAPQPAIRLVEVHKRYPLFGRRRDRLKVLLGMFRGVSFTNALQDVTFDVGAGQAVAIIGENGSGKSTLLRLIAGISQPDKGSISTDQPVSAILELGLGFHPDFTGRENAMLYGMMLGVPEPTMRERLAEMLAFAELGEYIDQPLRTYSSGMTARLAFAVATNVDPRVLIVDEALAVGDGAFQKKCIDRMVRFRDEGRTVLFCSHVMYLVTSFCQRAIWLNHGRIEADGDVHKVVGAYETYLKQREQRAGLVAGEQKPLLTPGAMAHLEPPVVLALDGSEREELRRGEGFLVDVRFEAESPASAFHVGVAVDTAEGRCLFTVATHRDGLAPLSGQRSYRVRLRVPALPVAEATMIVAAYLFDEHGLHIYSQSIWSGKLRVRGEEWTPSLLDLAHEWVVE